jgi:hypothetical protein
MKQSISLHAMSIVNHIELLLSSEEMLESIFGRGAF